MLCILCVQPSEQFIHIFQDEGIALNISEIIANHFWLQPNVDDVNANLICTSCWNTLSLFHKFYLRVEEAHVGLHETNTIQESKLEQATELKFNENIGIIPTTEIKLEAEEVFEQTIPLFTVLELQGDTDLNLIPETAPPDTYFKKLFGNEAPSTSFISSRTSAAEGNSCIVKMENDSQSLSPGCQNSDSNDDEDEEDGDWENSSSKQQKPRQSQTNSANKGPHHSKKTAKNTKINEHDELIANTVKLSCDICALVFPKFIALKKHYRLVHNRNGYATCCGVRLFKRCILVDHINRHKNPEYFKCAECGRVLSTRKNLKRHMLTHNLDQRTRDYHCDQCALSFYTNNLLSRHLHTHISGNNIKCPHCDKFFSTEFLVRRHIHGAHNTKFKNCDQCEMAFRTVNALRQHKLEHNEIFQKHKKDISEPIKQENLE